MIDPKKFPKLNKIQEKGFWFIHTYKDGGIAIFKPMKEGRNELSELESRFLGDHTIDDKFFHIKIKENKLWFHNSTKRDLYGSSVTIEDVKGNIIPDILTKETIEKAITKDTIVLYHNNITDLIDLDCTIEEYFENNTKYTFEFI